MKSVVLSVDFKTRQVVDRVETERVVPTNEEMSNFNSPQGNFVHFSDHERKLHSQHIIKHLQDISLDDLIHFVNYGVVDKVELSKKMGLYVETSPATSGPTEVA